MKKCFFLLPTSYNDGKEVPPAIILDIFEELYVNFGGYTNAGIAEGEFRMEDGTRARDCSLQIWVVMDEEKVPLMRKLVKKFGKILGQEKMLFEVMNWPGELI